MDPSVKYFTQSEANVFVCFLIRFYFIHQHQIIKSLKIKFPLEKYCSIKSVFLKLFSISYQLIGRKYKVFFSPIEFFLEKENIIFFTR